MAETYCGKSCQDCTWRQENSCPGCKMGPGAKYGGDCEIAKCALAGAVGLMVVRIIKLVYLYRTANAMD